MKSAMTLEDHLNNQYRFNVIADPDGGYVIEYPDLSGCMTQVESIDEVSEAAREIFELWIESAYDDGADIPKPTYPEEFSGKFVLRLPRSLHRRLAEMAGDENVSLNQFAVALLAEGLGRVSSVARMASAASSSPSPRIVAEDFVEYDQPEHASHNRQDSGA